ncbi:anthrone oxygenase family protein [Plastoroseomonas arctica]|uniref:DUF1772 domain-containing protein n=1 Tax=Plastoroseomonas arctica TaxID=1509237 RepID=A0AAF1KPC1_9PROT|nr:anthrone oxygenase family protein [Plastoroseomonas arctica]MBR0655708.1 DUF1772 domain-containing protein [Plastoroseomonas arctica]
MLTLVLIGIALIAAILSAGLYYAFSGPVMRGFAAGTPETAVAVMRAINSRIMTPLFAFVFFGPSIFALLGALAAWREGRSDAASCACAASVIHALGAIAVTMTVHLPLNTALERGTGAATDLWRAYAPRWTAWNHLRSIALLLAAALLVAALHLALPAP